jgi:DinB superfamily
MASIASKDMLLAELDRVVRETLAYFDGAGRVTAARVDRWHARDVLMHFIYFHDATAWGLQSAAVGGPPWPLPTDADRINEVCRRLHEHESFDELLTQLRQAHARLVQAARNASDLDTPCFRRPNGEPVTGRQRLEVLARHWAEHVRELQAAAKTTA